MGEDLSFSLTSGTVMSATGIRAASQAQLTFLPLRPIEGSTVDGFGSGGDGGSINSANLWVWLSRGIGSKCHDSSNIHGKIFDELRPRRPPEIEQSCHRCC